MTLGGHCYNFLDRRLPPRYKKSCVRRSYNGYF
jgi:hypothetical protein